MKKRILCIALFVMICVSAVISSLTIKPLSGMAAESLRDFVCRQLDKEEEERQRKIANGEIVSGKDTVCIWGNMFEIGHYPSGNHLEIYTDGLRKPVLRKVTKHKAVKKKLYILSEEGYAVIDEDNLCRALVTAPEDESNCEKRSDENEYIRYLSDFDEFSEDEQAVFNKLK